MAGQWGAPMAEKLVLKKVEQLVGLRADWTADLLG